MVAAITDQTKPLYGADTEALVFFDLSPVRLIDGITTPVLAAFSTADMLVPIDQLGREMEHRRHRRRSARAARRSLQIRH